MYKYPLVDFAVLPAVTDFFKWIPSSEFESGSLEGDIESSYGTFGLVSVDSDLIALYGEECGEDELRALEVATNNATMDVMPLGLYLVTYDSAGFVWAERGELELATRHEFNAKREAYETECKAGDD